MLEQTPHETSAIALEDTVCLEVDRHDIAVLLERKPLAGMDMLTVLGRQFHASQQLVRLRASRNPNELIETESTFGERIAALRWFLDIHHFLPGRARHLRRHQHRPPRPRLGSLSIHPSKPVSFHVGRHPSACNHDEPEPPGHERSPARRARLRRQPPLRIRNSGPLAKVKFVGRQNGRRRRFDPPKTLAGNVSG